MTEAEMREKLPALHMIRGMTGQKWHIRIQDGWTLCGRKFDCWADEEPLESTEVGTTCFVCSRMQTSTVYAVWDG